MNFLTSFRNLVLFGLLALPGNATKAGNPVDPDFKRNLISFNLATPFDPSFPRLRLGYTYVISPYFSQTFEFGYGNRKLFPDSTFYTHHTLKRDYRLWEIRTECRYYFAGIRRYVIPYAALEMYYLRHRQTMFENNFQPENNEYAVHYDRADFLRTKTGFNVKAGLIFRMGPVLALECYGGIGTRARNNRYTNVIGADFQTGPDWFDDWNYFYYEGLRWNFNLTFGVKMNFMF